MDAGYADVSVLDVSTRALQLARGRLGDRGRNVHWLTENLLAWTPDRRYAIWHDRALLHFFAEDAQRTTYAAQIRAALAPNGHAIIATFARGGPTSCSGLPSRPSSGPEILDLLGREFKQVSTTEEQHRTPSGQTQPFTWLVARRSAD